MRQQATPSRPRTDAPATTGQEAKPYHGSDRGRTEVDELIEAGVSIDSEGAPGEKRRKVEYPAIVPRADFGLGGSIESSSVVAMEGRGVAKVDAPRADRRSAREKRRMYYVRNIERETQCSKAYRQKNRARCRAYQRHYKENNRVKCQELSLIHI